MKFSQLFRSYFSIIYYFSLIYSVSISQLFRSYFPLGKDIAPVCCADGYTTVLLCRVLVDCMSYQGTAETQYFYTDPSN